MDYDKEYITKSRKAEFEKELEYLEGARRREILTALESAKALGDLSENAEYHDAREQQGRNEDRIKYINHVLKTSILVDEDAKRDVVCVGATVVVKKDNVEEKTFSIVGAEETDILNGKISHHSPLGAILFGKKVGDTAVLTTPKGDVSYTIVSIH